MLHLLLPGATIIVDMPMSMRIYSWLLRMHEGVKRPAITLQVGVEVWLPLVTVSVLLSAFFWRLKGVKRSIT